MEVYIYPVTQGQRFANPVDGRAMAEGTERGWAYRLVMGIFQPRWLWNRPDKTSWVSRRKLRKMVTQAVRQHQERSFGMIFLSPGATHWLDHLLKSGWRTRPAGLENGFVSYWLESN